MSLARSSKARSSKSLTARTTGAPLARSRRLSISSSPWRRSPGSATSTASAVCLSSRRSRTVAMSSKEATAIVTGPPQTISAARIAAPSAGSDTARPKPSSPNRNGKTDDSRKKRAENCSTAPTTLNSSCRLSRGNLQKPATSSANFPPGKSDFSHSSRSPFPAVVSPGLTRCNFALAASGIRSSRCIRNCSTERFGTAAAAPCTAGDLPRPGIDFDMSCFAPAASHICRLKIEHHAGLDLDRMSLLDMGLEFPLPHGFLDVSPLCRGSSYHVNVLHAAVRRYDHAHWNRSDLRTDSIGLHPAHNILGSVVLETFRNGIGHLFFPNRSEIVQ